MHKIVEQCGTVPVRLAPLFMVIGAAVSVPNGPEIETIIEMLFPEDSNEDK